MSYPLNNNCFGDIFKARDPRLNDKKYKQKASTITVSRKILAVTKEQAEKILKMQNLEFFTNINNINNSLKLN